jgi:hypothetical protein
MTPSGYRAVLKSWGLKEVGPSADGHRLYSTREGLFLTIEDPEGMTEDQMEAQLALIGLREGFTRDC